MWQDNHGIYEQILQEHGSTVPLFFQSWWLDAACAPYGWQAWADAETGRVWPLLKKRKGPFSYATMPLFTPLLGLFPAASPFSTADSAAIYDGLKRSAYTLVHLPHSATDIADILTKQGWIDQPRAHYILPRGTELSNLEVGINNLAKRNIKKAKEQLQLRKTDNAQTLYQLIVRSLQRHSERAPCTLSSLQQLVNAAHIREQGIILEAYDNLGQVHAAIFLAWDQQMSYYVAGGLDERIHQVGASRWLLWKAMQEAVSNGRGFHFGGDLTPTVAQVYASLGGEKRPYHRFLRYNSPWVRQGLMLLKKWRAALNA